LKLLPEMFRFSWCFRETVSAVLPCSIWQGRARVEVSFIQDRCSPRGHHYSKNHLCYLDERNLSSRAILTLMPILSLNWHFTSLGERLPLAHRQRGRHHYRILEYYLWKKCSVGCAICEFCSEVNSQECDITSHLWYYTIWRQRLLEEIRNVLENIGIPTHFLESMGLIWILRRNQITKGSNQMRSF